jgi:hypothetical protein
VGESQLLAVRTSRFPRVVLVEDAGYGRCPSTCGEKGDDPWLEVSLLSGCDGGWPVEDEVDVDADVVGSDAK